MSNRFHAPLLGVGPYAFFLLMAAMVPLVIFPPRIRQGAAWRLSLAALCLGFIAVGLQLLWTQRMARDSWLDLGLILMLAGSLSLVLLLALDPQGWVYSNQTQGKVLSPRFEAALFLLALCTAVAFRFYKLGDIPVNWWFDEVNLTLRTVDDVLRPGKAPLYVGRLVENPGLYLHVGAAAMKWLGSDIDTYRLLSAFYGSLGGVMFYFLARLWFGPRWAWAAMLTFVSLRWAFVPQRIAFMSGFAMFWVIGSVAFFWQALRRDRWWQWVVAGLFAGTTWHCYTPSRALLPLLILFTLLNWRSVMNRVRWRGAGLFFAGALLPLGAIAWVMASHWELFWKRAGEVSIMADIKTQGWIALWISLKRHLLMFHYLGDHNGRHNLPFWPSVDFATGIALAPAFFWTHFKAFKDARARLLTLWFWVMLLMGVLSVLVEAPQAHRTVLIVPALALMIFLFAADFSVVLRRWMASDAKKLLPAALVFLLMVPLFNAYEYFKVYRSNVDVWRSFSPVSSAAVRRMQAQPLDWMLLQSRLENEYQFHGYEWQFFSSWFLNRQGRVTGPLLVSNRLSPRAWSPRGVLCLWGVSDTQIRQAAKAQFPDRAIETKTSDYSGEVVYEAMEIPWEQLPRLSRHDSKATKLFLYIMDVSLEGG